MMRALGDVEGCIPEPMNSLGKHEKVGTIMNPKDERFISFKKLFDIEPLITSEPYSSSRDVTAKLTSKTFGGLPSSFLIGNCRLKSFMTLIKKIGKVEMYVDRTFERGISSSFHLKVSPSDDPRDSIFINVEEIFAVKSKLHKEYVDDIIEPYEDIPVISSPTISVHSANEQIYDIINDINKKCTIISKDNVSSVEMIVSTQAGLQTQTVNLDFDYSDDLDLHYGEGFSEFNDKLIEKINSVDKGIAMFHGVPGTGKTHYIRRLLPSLSKAGKRVILIPRHVLGSLESPGFNEFMLRNFVGQKIVFIMEDAESIISKRPAAGGGRSELVSTLLNITDGILNDVFNIQVILTFNTELEKIDEALLRKGRLIAKHSFRLLTRNEAVKLADHIGVTINDHSGEYTLADIYGLMSEEEDNILINRGPKKISDLGF